MVTLPPLLSDQGLGGGYARDIARFFATDLTPVQRQLAPALSHGGAREIRTLRSKVEIEVSLTLAPPGY